MTTSVKSLLRCRNSSSVPETNKVKHGMITHSDRSRHLSLYLDRIFALQNKLDFIGGRYECLQLFLLL
jgi:hypothetical protein